MKTGTTYLQQVMTLNKAALAEAGYLFPGDQWAEQSRGARDVLGFGTRDPSTRAELDGTWHRLAEQMLSHRGTASVYSMEFLSFANAEKAARVVESLSGAEVHVILTVRDTAAVVPAQWQTSCRNGGTVPWPKFVRGLRELLAPETARRTRAGRVIQRTQGIVRMLEVWGPVVGRERLHVVTVPPRGSDPRLLWERFSQVVGLDPNACPVEPESSNVSLGHASTELLRRLNVELGSVPRRDYEKVVRGHLRSILGQRARLEERVTLNRKGLRLAARWNGRVRAAIEDSGAHVVGTLQDLPVHGPDPSAPKSLARLRPEDILAAAATARDGLLTLERELRERQLQPETPATTLADWEACADPEARAVSDVADLVRRCMRLTGQEIVSRRA